MCAYLIVGPWEEKLVGARLARLEIHEGFVMPKPDKPRGNGPRLEFAKLVAKAWSDAKLKAQLLRRPAAALATVGIRVPKGVTVKVVENTADRVYLVLPSLPREDEASDPTLDRAVRESFIALTELDIEVPKGVTVKFVANTTDTVHLVLPPPPPEDELSDWTLYRVARGSTKVCCICACVNGFCDLDEGGTYSTYGETLACIGPAN